MTLTIYQWWRCGYHILLHLYEKKRKERDTYIFATGEWLNLTKTCKSNVCLVGKTAIVTGANSALNLTGIGYDTAEDFAKRGARVILACRDPGRGKDAVERIIRATDNANVIYKPLDLSSFQSIKAFADDVKNSEERLDILVNNAGVGGFVNTSTGENGLLLVMLCNYYGPFLLTNLLLPLLIKTENSRIVNVSSEVAKYGQLNLDKINILDDQSNFKNGFKLYKNSKLCNILFTIELASILKPTTVTTYSLHPGVVSTNIFRNMSPVLKKLITFVLHTFCLSSFEGAQTSIYCSITKGIEWSSGEHYSNCQYVPKYKTAEDPELPKRLWKVTEKLVQLEKYK
ncbi:hypothetical protein ABEB36_009055 [Hypothenemus hampei]|uniref:Uncharacterized protein n=1 Tax=Hypothenemus hampei TaxID=57062 RepID=A0ABD1EP00_HYPHA